MQMSWADSTTKYGDEAQCNAFVDEHLGSFIQTDAAMPVENRQVHISKDAQNSASSLALDMALPSSEYTDTLL